MSRKRSGKTKTGRPAPPGKRTQQDPDALTPQEELFLHEYIANGGNGTRAYLNAYPSCASHEAAAANACRVLRRDRVQKALAAHRADRLKRLEMDGDEAIALLSLSARANIRDAYDEQGKLLPVHRWPESLQLAVKSIKPGPFGDTIVLHDGLKARELLAIAQGRLKNAIDIHHRFDHAKYLADGEEPA